MSPRIQKLHDAVQTAHRVRAFWVSSTPIREMMGDKVVWEGVVEEFAIDGHPQNAPICYAWSYQDGNETQFVTVLRLPPVKSAQGAVRAYIASLAKSGAPR